jgi:pilus assembly protein FimV
MIAKRSSRALALLLALPSAAFALGLGDIRLLSPLNAPLEAEIDLVDVTPEEMSTVQAQLASRDTFARYGLDWPPFLSGVQVKTVKTGDGREIIKLKSTDPISDPFVTLLVEVNWARGRLVREYTMLLDPPVFTPKQSQVASAPVSAPAVGSGTHEGTIARAAETPAPAAPPAMPAAPAAAPEMPAAVAAPAAAAAIAAAAPAAEAAPAPAPAPVEPAAAPAEAAPAAAEAASTVAETPPPPTAPAPEPAPALAQAAPTIAPAPIAEATPALEPDAAAASPPPTAGRPSESESEGTHTVRRGETLSQIAAGVAGQKANSAHMHSWMLAIYQANPRAFQSNMNVLHSGAVLRIPDAEAAAAISPSEASSEIRRQYAAWRGATPASPVEVAAAQPGRLKLVTPSESASAGAAPGASSGESAALQGRVHELEGQLAESKRLLEMKDAELARMQAQLAAKQAEKPAPAPAAAPPPAVAPPRAEQPPVAQAAPPPAPPAAAPEEKPPVVAEEKPPAAAPPAVVASVPPPARAPKAVPPPESGGSFLGTVVGYWWVLLIAALAAGAVAAVRILRSRRASQFDDSLGRLAVAGAGADFDLGFADRAPAAAPAAAATAGSTARASAAGEAPMRARAAPLPEAAFLVEETGTHERPRLTPAGAPAAPTARHVASDETISSETAINLDQGDPLAEADFHMAYGLYDQAADLIRIAISREPNRRDLKLKLLEVFFVWGNKDQFLQTARELAQTRAEAAPGEWEKILIMGKQLAPEDPLFSGAAAVTGAAAGGVDLDLEGGQSRVDFDLLGEPVPGEAAHGVDLDIGTAVGDHAEATTGITDRNVALTENSFLGSTGTTGTTRQMTARMRQDSGTAEIEGPTVEQPALPDAHQPTIRQKVESAMRKSVSDATAELAIDDLGLDVGGVDTVDQPGPTTAAASNPDTPTLVAGMDDRSRRVMEDAQRRANTEENAAIASTGAWQFDQNELEAALTQTSVALDPASTGRLAALRAHGVDVDLSDATGTHAATATDVDLDVGAATGTHGNGRLDLDVGTATVPDAAFAATQRLASEELALPDLEPVTMSEVGTKLDLARAYMDMGDPDGARNILEEVLNEGSAAQKQEAQRLMESLP